MARPRFIIIDGKRVLWSRLLEQGRTLLAETKQAAKLLADHSRNAHAGDQPTLFVVKDDSRPAVSRRADGRYRQPGLFEHDYHSDRRLTHRNV